MKTWENWLQGGVRFKIVKIPKWLSEKWTFGIYFNELNDSCAKKLLYDWTLLSTLLKGFGIQTDTWEHLTLVLSLRVRGTKLEIAMKNGLGSERWTNISF